MHLKEPNIYRLNRQVQDPAFYLSSSVIKAPIYVFIVSFMVGFGRLLFIGYHPVIQGVLLGLICGTITGKLLRIEQTKSEKPWVLYAWMTVVPIIAIIGQLLGIKYSLPTKSLTFLTESWVVGDFREAILWNPIKQPSEYLNKTNQLLWFSTQCLDLIALSATAAWAVKVAKNTQKHSKRLQSEWPVNRMLLLFACFIFSLYFTSKPLIKANVKAIDTWGQELWSDQIMTSLYNGYEHLNENPKSTESLRLLDRIQSAANNPNPFPEGHLWIALEQIEKGNRFLIKDELDRAVWETERLDRRILLPDGSKIPRGQFLAHLYQLRSKYFFSQEQYLLAERDLTVSIELNKDFWLDEKRIKEGFYPQEQTTLSTAGLSHDFGFGSAHYERHLARMALGDKIQASYDLKEAESLGYSPVTQKR